MVDTAQTAEKWPLGPRRPDGRYQKKVAGKLYYFKGTPDEALAEWLRVKPYLLAGRTPPPKACGKDVVTLQYVCDAFLTSAEAKRDAGTLSYTSWHNYQRTLQALVDSLGANRAVDELGPADFRQLRTKWAQYSLSTIRHKIIIVRTALNYAVVNRLVDRSPHYGSDFELPSAKERRIYQVRQYAERGVKAFSAAELAQLINAAGVQMRAMILLGVNCGYGNSDVGLLLQRSVDLDGGWVAQPRSKTGIPRRAKLWPETIAAIKAAQAKRPRAKRPEDDKYVFLTRRGACWAKDRVIDGPLSKSFLTLMRDVGCAVPGRNFYALRHTFRTIARRARDVDAVRSVMGHVSGHVETVYEHEDVADDRLAAVADIVRAWLLPELLKIKQEKTNNV
jgi:integrase